MNSLKSNNREKAIASTGESKSIRGPISKATSSITKQAASDAASTRRDVLGTIFFDAKAAPRNVKGSRRYRFRRALRLNEDDDTDSDGEEHPLAEVFPASASAAVLRDIWALIRSEERNLKRRRYNEDGKDVKSVDVLGVHVNKRSRDDDKGDNLSAVGLEVRAEKMRR